MTRGPGSTVNRDGTSDAAWNTTVTVEPSIPIGASSSMFTPASPRQRAASATVPGLSSSLAVAVEISRKPIPASLRADRRPASSFA